MRLFDLKQAAFLGTIALVAVPGVLVVQEKTQADPAAEVAQVPPVRVRKEPDAYVAPVNGSIEMTLVNTSPSIISYMEPGDSRFTDLEPDEEVTLSATTFPFQVGITQLDGGLSYAEVSSVSEREGSVTIELEHLGPNAADYNPDLITRSIVVGPTGRIYID